MAYNPGYYSDASEQNFLNPIINTRYFGVPIANNKSENNCFISVIIHILYNIPQIKSFLLSEEFSDKYKHSFLIELKDVMKTYQYFSEFNCNKTLDISAFRISLAHLFDKDNKFQVGQMDDSAEVLVSVLKAVHNYKKSINLSKEDDTLCNPVCPSHNTFYISLIEQQQCICGWSSEVVPYYFNYFTYEIYMNQVLDLFKKNMEEISMMNVLKQLNAESSLLCGSTNNPNIQNHLMRKMCFLLNKPNYFTFNLIMPEYSPRMVDIGRMFICVPILFEMHELYYMTVNNISEELYYELFGIICYGQSHYICFIRFVNEGIIFWEQYDDNKIKRLSSLKDVIMSCVNANFYPTLLFYRKCSKLNKTEIRMKKSEEIGISDRKIVLSRCAERDEFIQKNKFINENTMNNSFQLLKDETDYKVRDDFKNSTTITTNDVNLLRNEALPDSYDTKAFLNGYNKPLIENTLNNPSISNQRFNEPFFSRKVINYNPKPSNINHNPSFSNKKVFKESIYGQFTQTQPCSQKNNQWVTQQFNSDSEKINKDKFQAQINTNSNKQMMSKHIPYQRENDNNTYKFVSNNVNKKRHLESVENDTYINNTYNASTKPYGTTSYNYPKERKLNQNREMDGKNINNTNINLSNENTRETLITNKQDNVNNLMKEKDEFKKKMADRFDFILSIIIILISVIAFVLMIF